MTSKMKDPEPVPTDPTTAAIDAATAAVQANATARIVVRQDPEEQAPALAAVPVLNAQRAQYGPILAARRAKLNKITVDLGANGRQCAGRIGQLITWIEQGFEHADHVARHVGQLKGLSLADAEPEQFRPSVMAAARQAFRHATEMPRAIEEYWVELEERWKELGEHVRRATPVAVVSPAADATLEVGPGRRPRFAQGALSRDDDE